MTRKKRFFLLLHFAPLVSTPHVYVFVVSYVISISKQSKRVDCWNQKIVWRKRRKKFKSPATKQLNSRVCRLRIWTVYKMAISQPYRIQWEREKKNQQQIIEHFLLNFIFVVDSRAPRTLCKQRGGCRPFYVCARCRFRITNYSRCWKSRNKIFRARFEVYTRKQKNRIIFNAVSFSSKKTVGSCVS